MKLPWLRRKKKAHARRKAPNQELYNSQAWRRLRKAVLSKQPLCEVCRALGIYTKANVVDHIVRVNDGGAAFDERNLMPMCKRCHDKKSGRESQGFSIKATQEGVPALSREEIIKKLIYDLDDDNHEEHDR